MRENLDKLPAIIINSNRLIKESAFIFFNLNSLALIINQRFMYQDQSNPNPPQNIEKYRHASVKLILHRFYNVNTNIKL